MIFEPALAVLVAMAVVMVAAWAFCLWRGSGGWTDVFWTWGTGAALAVAALVPLQSRGWPPGTGSGWSRAWRSSGPCGWAFS